MLKFFFIIKIVCYFDIIVYFTIHTVYLLIGYFTSKCFLLIYIYIKLYLSLFFLINFLLLVSSNMRFSFGFSNTLFLSISNNHDIKFYNILLNINIDCSYKIYYYIIMFSLSFCAPLFYIDGISDTFTPNYIPINFDLL